MHFIRVRIDAYMIILKAIKKAIENTPTEWVDVKKIMELANFKRDFTYARLYEMETKGYVNMELKLKYGKKIKYFSITEKGYNYLGGDIEISNK